MADLPGISATFSPAGGTVAYLKLTDNPDLLAAVKAVDEAPLAAQNRGALLQALQWQVLRTSSIVVRDLATGQEKELAAPGLMKANLAYAADGRSLYFLGGREGQDDQNDIYAIADGAAPARVGDAPGLKGAPLVDPSGDVVLYTVGAVNPFRQPSRPVRAGAAAAVNPRPPSFGVSISRRARRRPSRAPRPALSADGEDAGLRRARGGEIT